MIFAIVGEELGLIGSTAVIVAFVVFAWAGFRIALQCRDPFGKRLAAGITTLVCGQAAINLCAVLGIAPLTGIPLPFVSYGGSSLIVLLAAVGVLLNIAVNDRIVEARNRDRGGRDRRSRQARARSREALRARGATVTFAGSPGRVESQLVPEAGFELDTFAISGFPRTPSIAARPFALAGGQGAVRVPCDPPPAQAGRRSRRRWLRRRADGARRPARRDPGRVDRGRRASRARESSCRPVRVEALPRLRDPGSDGRQVRGRRAADSGRPPRRHPRERARALRPPRRRAGSGGLRRARRRHVAERDGRRRLGRGRARRCSTSPASATSRRFAPRAPAPGYVLMAQTDHFGDVLAAADVAVSRAGGTVWELAAAGTPSMLVPYPHATADHQTLNARHFERGGGAIVVPNAEIGTCAGARRRAARRPAAARGDEGRNALDGPRRRGRHDRRGGDRACPAADDAGAWPTRGPVRAASLLRRHRWLGNVRLRQRRPRPRCGRAGWDVRDTIFMESLEGIDVDLGGEPSPPAGWEIDRLDRASAPDRGHAAGGLPRRARRRAAGDRRRWRPREDDDGRDDRVRARGDGARSLAGSSAASFRSSAATPASAPAGSSSRATSPTARSVRSRPQIAVITNIELDHHATYASEAELRAFFDHWLADVPHVVRSWELAPVELELAVPGDHNRQNAAAALAALELAGVPRAGGRGRIVALHRGRAPVRARRRARAGSPSTTTTAITRPSSRSRCGRRGR